MRVILCVLALCAVAVAQPTLASGWAQNTEATLDECSAGAWKKSASGQMAAGEHYMPFTVMNPTLDWKMQATVEFTATGTVSSATVGIARVNTATGSVQLQPVSGARVSLKKMKKSGSKYSLTFKAQTSKGEPINDQGPFAIVLKTVGSGKAKSFKAQLCWKKPLVDRKLIASIIMYGVNTLANLFQKRLLKLLPEDNGMGSVTELHPKQGGTVSLDTWAPLSGSLANIKKLLEGNWEKWWCNSKVTMRPSEGGAMSFLFKPFGDLRLSTFVAEIKKITFINLDFDLPEPSYNVLLFPIEELTGDNLSAAKAYAVKKQKLGGLKNPPVAGATKAYKYRGQVSGQITGLYDIYLFQLAGSNNFILHSAMSNIIFEFELVKRIKVQDVKVGPTLVANLFAINERGDVPMMNHSGYEGLQETLKRPGEKVCVPFSTQIRNKAEPILKKKLGGKARIVDKVKNAIKKYLNWAGKK